MVAGHFANASGLVSLGDRISFVVGEQPQRFDYLYLTENETNRTFTFPFPTTGDFAVEQVEITTLLILLS